MAALRGGVRGSDAQVEPQGAGPGWDRQTACAQGLQQAFEQFELRPGLGLTMPLFKHVLEDQPIAVVLNEAGQGGPILRLSRELVLRRGHGKRQKISL